MSSRRGSPLACSVRGCGQPLARLERSMTCPRGHAFDLARSGYVNLLQPQDRRSADAGDPKPVVEARARLLDAGVGRQAIDAMTNRAGALALPDGAVVVDLGCGAGETLAGLRAVRPIQGIGIDLSPAAADLAARRYPDLTWVVANADRRLPLLDASVDLVVSLHGRRNPAECARILRPGGSLLVAVPAPDDLVELREAVQGDATLRPRAEVLLAEHRERFRLVERSVVSEQRHLGRDHLLDLLRGTYRGSRTSAAARIDTLAAMTVTLASEIFVFAPSGPSGPTMSDDASEKGTA